MLKIEVMMKFGLLCFLVAMIIGVVVLLQFVALAHSFLCSFGADESP